MIWAYGTLVDTCWRALEALGEEAAGVTLVNARFAKPLDSALLADLAASHSRILTAEDHALPGGFGSVVAEAVTDLGLDLRLTRLGVRDELVPHASRARQLADHGLDVAGVSASIRRLIAPSVGTIPFRRHIG
jgi:1-deoxy-D-xylulose-5-phosphate synthase